MKILNHNFRCLETSRNITVSDSIVSSSNKLGTGHGEQKFYFGPKSAMNAFFGGKKTIKCFFLKSDLVSYMQDIKQEYEKPTQPYNGMSGFTEMWAKRNAMVAGLDDMVWFSVDQQDQIKGDRGYLNSTDERYNLFRELALPNTSYVMMMKLSGMGSDPIYYWKFFVDYKAIYERKRLPLVYTYGKKTPVNLVKFTKAGDLAKEIEAAKASDKRSRREAQKQKNYRNALFEELPFCPITGITEERLLIASHIKPFECCSSEKEGYDPQNGFLLSPLYDKLFDKGFISFTDDRHMLVSNWLSPANQRMCMVKNNGFYQKLPITEGRLGYLSYHRKHVFKG